MFSCFLFLSYRGRLKPIQLIVMDILFIVSCLRLQKIKYIRKDPIIFFYDIYNYAVLKLLE